MKKFGVFLLCFPAAIIGYVGGRLFISWAWGIQLGSPLGEIILGLAAGGFACAAIYGVAEHFLDSPDSNQVAIATVSSLGTLLVLLVAFAFWANFDKLGSEWMLLGSLLSVPVGFFSYVVLRDK